MAPGQAGPLHRFDGEQVWSVTAGAARLELEEESIDLRDGDTAVVPAAVLRRITADADSRAADRSGTTRFRS